MRAALVICILVFVAASCAPSPRYRRTVTVSGNGGEGVRQQGPYTVNGQTYTPMETAPVGKTYRGMASYYGNGDGFHGKPTSTGEVFDMYGLTAAHRTLPFNTWVEVRNLANQRTVIVRVNDRGPFVDGRLIDLSYGAASELHMLETGVQEVEITVLR